MGVYWIWYPGDFEIHQGMLQNFSREERGMRWPAYWYVDDNYCNVKFERTYTLKQATTFTVHTRQAGYLTINDKKYLVNQPITLDAGKQEIVAYIFSATEQPTVYIEGEVIHSDASWVADNYVTQRAVGYSNLFTTLDDDPNVIPYEEHDVQPKTTEAVNGGLLIDFGKEINAKLRVANQTTPITICYGESRTEALDTVNCYYQQAGITSETKIPKRAFQYLFVPNYQADHLDITATTVGLKMPNRSSFKSNETLINQIWDMSTRTFKLCTDLFYIDGVKRDRWIWGGDAYQDAFINQYTFFNEDVDKRTIIALRGHDEIKQHINTIVDYSLLWVISIYNHYETTGDQAFIRMIMPRMESMMDYLLAQTNKLGFIYGRKGDWIFVDWSEMDKDGTIAAEQMFLLQALKAMMTAKEVIGEDPAKYQDCFTTLKANVVKYFWNDQKGAFIDSYESGKNHVTRHANILAVLFDLVDADKQQQILKNVLLNDQITQLTTPYFKFFEQDALCRLGQLPQVLATIKDYWGAMVKKGATTVWEEYDPQVQGKDQYAMYGDPFGKSLCHAWGASPIYLLGRYFLGLQPTKAGYETFEVQPHLDDFTQLDCSLPVKGGQVDFHLADGQLTVTSTRDGGVVIADGQRLPLKKGQAVKVDVKLTV